MPVNSRPSTLYATRVPGRPTRIVTVATVDTGDSLPARHGPSKLAGLSLIDADVVVAGGVLLAVRVGVGELLVRLGCTELGLGDGVGEASGDGEALAVGTAGPEVCRVAGDEDRAGSSPPLSRAATTRPITSSSATPPDASSTVGLRCGSGSAADEPVSSSSGSRNRGRPSRVTSSSSTHRSPLPARRYPRQYAAGTYRHSSAKFPAAEPVTGDAVPAS
ncbi:hypothetical protein GCM10010399_56920 [Dactylosporangium fulvum]